MKRFWTYLAVSFAVVASSALGDDQEQRKVELTGSHVPRLIRSIGRTADTPYPIYIITREEIDQSGAFTLADVLRRAPFVTSVRGH
jgi:outer membrane cobalamin receptor